MTEIERISRLICEALHATSPDVLVAPSGFIFSVAGMQALPDTGALIPLWRIFEPAARAIIADAEWESEKRKFRPFNAD